MTQQEKNTIAAGLLVFSTAAEELMHSYLNMQHVQLAGEGKMLFNNMQRAVREARYYYERLNNMFATALVTSDKSFRRADMMRQDADYLIRLYLRLMNLEELGYPSEEVEKTLRRLQDKATENDSEQPSISEQVIDKFRIVTK